MTPKFKHWCPASTENYLFCCKYLCTKKIGGSICDIYICSSSEEIYARFSNDKFHFETFSLDRLRTSLEISEQDADVLIAYEEFKETKNESEVQKA